MKQKLIDPFPTEREQLNKAAIRAHITVDACKRFDRVQISIPAGCYSIVLGHTS